jgi:hypothetical protein
MMYLWGVKRGTNAMIRKRMTAVQRAVFSVSVVCIITAATVLSHAHQREVLAVVGTTQAHSTMSSTSVVLPTTLVQARGASAVAPHVNAIDDCVVSKTNVLLVGNRPVGTYLCSYFPAAKRITGGCSLPCGGGSAAPFMCTILNMGSKSQLASADIVVNHHGPVPTKFSPLEPVMTLFYSGESNISEGKKAAHSYQTKYDSVVSFHQHRQWYFTWTNRFEAEFRAVLTGTLQHDWPPWDQRRNAIAIFVSRCKKGGREAVMQAVGKVYPVHSYGKCHKTHSIETEFPKCAAMLGGRYPQKLCVFRQYKYILALDNSREDDYVTEKVYHALISGAVPLYDGAPNADHFLPGGWSSVIRLAEYEDSSGGVVGYPRLQETLRTTQDESSPRLATLRRWSSATSEAEWGSKFVDNLHHGEPTCDVCDAARRKKCGDN